MTSQVGIFCEWKEQIHTYINFIVACWPDKRCLSHVSLSGHDDVALFEWRRQWHWIDTKNYRYVIIASLNSESACKLINRIPGLHLLIYQVRVFWYQVYQARLWEWILNRSASLAMSTSILKALPGKLDIKSTNLVFSIYMVYTLIIFNTWIRSNCFLLNSNVGLFISLFLYDNSCKSGTFGNFIYVKLVLALNAPIATKVVCFSRLLKCLRSPYGKQCWPRPDCSSRSSLFWVHAVCFYT